MNIRSEAIIMEQSSDSLELRCEKVFGGIGEQK